MSYSVIRLTVEWAEQYKSLRLASLKERPQNFVMTYAEQLLWVQEDYHRHLQDMFCYGVAEEGRLVAIATLRPFPYQAVQHKVLLSEVYIDPAHRGKGIARMLLSYVIENAKGKGYTHMMLSVESENKPAFALYESLGFVQYGYEEASICLDGVMYDDIWMNKRLQEKA